MPSLDPALPDDLLAGFHRFRRNRFAAEHERYRRLEREGQHPTTLIVACSDSRSGPETIFDAHPGELFVIRNIVGLVPVYEPDERSHATSAALEYALLGLGVPSVVVMGHGRCGGIAAALENPAPLTATDFLGSWVAGLRDIADDLDPQDWLEPARRHLVMEHRAVEQSIANLRTFPWIRSREQTGAVTLHGAWFDIGLGELHALTPGGWRQLPDA